MDSNPSGNFFLYLLVSFPFSQRSVLCQVGDCKVKSYLKLMPTCTACGQTASLSTSSVENNDKGLRRNKPSPDIDFSQQAYLEMTATRATLQHTKCVIAWIWEEDEEDASWSGVNKNMVSLWGHLKTGQPLIQRSIQLKYVPARKCFGSPT